MSFDHSLRLVGLRASLGVDRALQLEALKLACELGVGLFRRGNALPSETVEFTIGGRGVRIPGGTDIYNTCARWLSAYGLALLLRDGQARASLCAYDPGNFESDLDHYQVLLAKALIAAATGQRGVARKFEEAEIKALRTTGIAWGRRLGAPLVRLARAVYLKKWRSFDAVVAEALDGYAAFHSRKGERHRTEAYLPTLHLGLCTMAHDEGVDVGVESDYLPDWIFQL